MQLLFSWVFQIIAHHYRTIYSFSMHLMSWRQSFIQKWIDAVLNVHELRDSTDWKTNLRAWSVLELSHMILVNALPRSAKIIINGNWIWMCDCKEWQCSTVILWHTIFSIVRNWQTTATNLSEVLAEICVHQILLWSSLATPAWQFMLIRHYIAFCVIWLRTNCYYFSTGHYFHFQRTFVAHTHIKYQEFRALLEMKYTYLWEYLLTAKLFHWWASSHVLTVHIYTDEIILMSSAHWNGRI